MSTANLFYAISEAICISIVQGILTFALIKTVFAFFPNIPSLWKYRILFGSLIFLFSGFIYAAIKFYAPEIQIAVIKSKSLTPESITMLETLRNFLRAHSTPIFCLYSLGLFVHVLSLFSGLYKIKNLRKDRSLIQLPKWDILVNSGILKLGINQNVQLFFSEKILTPFTTGFIKPVIYFPVGMLTQLSTEQVEAILLHELAHIKRNDYLINIIQKLIETILFFNPVVWLFARDLKSEREYCCDDLVLFYTNNPGTYAKALLLLEENKRVYNQLAMAADGAGKHSLLNRIKRLNVMKTVNSNPKQKLIALAVLVLVSITMAWAIPVDSIKVKKANAKIISKYQVPPPPPAPPKHESSASKDDVPPPPPSPPKHESSGSKNDVPPPPPAPPKHESSGSKNDVPPPPPSPPKLKSPDFKNDVPTPPPAPPKRKKGADVQDTTAMNQYFNSKEWKDQQLAIQKSSEDLKKHFESAEWKSQQQAIQKNAEAMSKRFNSKEWKAQQQAIKKSTDNIKKYFDSPEWKKQQQLIAKSSEDIKKHFESAEWKAQVDEMAKSAEKFDSPEWAAQIEQMKTQVEQMKIQIESPEMKKEMEKARRLEKKNIKAEQKKF